jgi:hypothetical protein
MTRLRIAGLILEVIAVNIDVEVSYIFTRIDDTRIVQRG